MSWKCQTKKKLQQIAFHHWSDIDFQDFINPYKKPVVKTYWFKPITILVIDTTLPSDNSWCFRKNLSETIWRWIIAIDDKVRD